jgi:hypothetical protein
MRVLLAILLLISQLIGQEPNPDKQKLNDEATVELGFRNPAAPMARLVLTEVETGTRDGFKTISYSGSVAAFSQKGPYILMSWDIGTNAPVISIKGVRLDESGTLRCGATKDCPNGQAGSVLLLRVSGMSGQPRRFVLTGIDKKPLALGEAVPFPAVGKDNACMVEAVILRPNASVVLLIGQGFVPREEVKRLSTSSGETVRGSSKADANGRVLSLVLPFVKGHDHGQTSYTYEGSKCHPTTTFNWGAYREEQSPTP